MVGLTSRAVRALVVCTFAVATVIACGSEAGSEFDGGGGAQEDGGGSQPPPLGTVEDSGTGTSSCKPKTCAEQGIECGPSGDGCGGVIANCGTCGPGLRCGGPNAPSKCVSPSVGTGCVPKTCAELTVSCGPAGDGCGGVLECGTCASGEQCGANGLPSQCVAVGPTGPDGGACVKKTCADYLAEGKNCGSQSDGCGGTLSCGTCTAPGEYCGGGGPSKCGVAGGGTCQKKTCTDYPNTCGPQSDGCGGVTVSCGGCTLPQKCGAGGTPGVCGGGAVTGPDGGACQPKGCAAGQCGTIADGCGGVAICGTTCPTGQTCGATAGQPNTCAVPACTRLTSCPTGMNCGSVSDGCGGSVSCGGTCPSPTGCGGGGKPNVCGGGVITAPDGGTCQAKTCAELGKNCGPVADGCGHIIQCGSCTSPEVCGGGTTPSVCGGGAQCTPRGPSYCTTNGLNCGSVADGCGGLLSCGPNSCSNGSVCGLTSANQCSSVDGGTGCTNFCTSIDNTCGATSRTRISGKIFAPNNSLPIPDAVIYVPNGSMTAPYGVQAITAGVAGGAGTCEQCSQTASGSPLVSTKSLADGSFTLTDVPAGIAFPIVIQLGKWRRMVTIPAVTKCTEYVIPASAQLTRLPRKQNEGNNGVDNIPRVAISTGSVDGLECVFRKLGIDQDQFTNPPGFGGSAGGRIELYRDRNTGGARINDDTPRTNDDLTDSSTHLNRYDAVVFGCTGSQNDKGDNERNRVRGYANRGGRVFATHFNYTWLYNNDTWANTANWSINGTNPGDGADRTWIGQINQTAGKRAIFASWLGDPAVNALTASNPPRITIVEPRNDVDRNVAAGAEEWITYHSTTAGVTAASTPPTPVLHYTFNTPFGSPAAQQCGRVLYSDFHVSIGNTSGEYFPDECLAGDGSLPALTAQEKVLAFFLFDLTSCITTTTQTCTPRTCANYPNTCGQQSNGCGGLTEDCGACPTGQTCGGNGIPFQCGGGTCTPRTCLQAGANCGTVPNGCGGTMDCGSCPGTQTCGGAGTPYQCGSPACTPRTCLQQNINCGEAGNGCGAILNCGTCPNGQACGAGGPGRCGTPTCTKLTVCPPGKTCGSIPDGCGGSVSCGTCTVAGQNCGGGGSPNTCGNASCTPKTCLQQGGQCGTMSDQCGSIATCGTCPPGQICNGQNKCVVPSCTPKTCAELGVECGPTADGCGNVVQCGNCPGGEACGAGGQPGICGTQACTPKTCAELGAVCGQVANGCGQLTTNCGDCSGALSCKNGACVTACTPRTCAEAGAQCGQIADGCGSLIDCGTCPNGGECGFAGAPNTCGQTTPK